MTSETKPGAIRTPGEPKGNRFQRARTALHSKRVLTLFTNSFKMTDR